MAFISCRGRRYALLLRGPADDDPDEPVRVQVTAGDPATAGQILDQIRALAVRHNVYRGRVISFDADADADARGRAGGCAAGFVDRRLTSPVIPRAASSTVRCRTRRRRCGSAPGT